MRLSSQSTVFRAVSGYHTGMPNPIRAWSLPLLLVVCCAVSGCTTRGKSAGKEKEEPTELTEAPLGSRIKRKPTVNPITSATREMIEQQRVQQGAVEAGMVNNPSKYSGRR
jgi:hypothetical protein